MSDELKGSMAAIRFWNYVNVVKVQRDKEIAIAQTKYEIELNKAYELIPTWTKLVAQYESEGLTRSDAQSAADVQVMKGNAIDDSQEE